MTNKVSIAATASIVVPLATGLYLSSLYNYLLFHSLAEIFSVVIAASIFLVMWNTRRYLDNNFLVFIGVAYLCIAGLDIFHTLSFPGMEIFVDYDYYANQLWIAARYIESLSFLIGFLFIGKIKTMKPLVVLFSYFFLFILVLSSIYWWKIFPEAYVEGKGQTTFKIASEYAIIFILGVSLIVLYRLRKRFERRVYPWIFGSIVVTMVSEFFFTLYFGNYELANLIGHYLKIISYYCIYKAIIEKGLSQPLSVYFKDLKDSEQELQRLNETKDKLFSILAHDLKSPFNSLIGFSELLLNNYSLFSDEERRKLFQMINKSSRQAHNLLDNLLQWSRTQTGALVINPESFDISETVKENIDLLSGPAKEKNISLENKSLDRMMVYADKNMISTVLRNLINNAVKFTEPGGKAAVCIRDLGDVVEARVTDTGVGMRPEVIKNLFSTKHYLSTLGTANEKGNGLGLVICKEFVEKNGGHISVESEPGKGSQFTFTVPKSPGNDGKR